VVEEMDYILGIVIATLVHWIVQAIKKQLLELAKKGCGVKNRSII
jgi:hypothetical protein